PEQRPREACGAREAPAPQRRRPGLVQTPLGSNPKAPGPPLSTVLPWLFAPPGLPGRRVGARGRIIRVGRIGLKPGKLEFFRRSGATGKVARGECDPLCRGAMGKLPLPGDLLAEPFVHAHARLPAEVPRQPAGLG